MIDLTYDVFLIVASGIGLLVTVFAAGVLGVLFYDTNRRNEAVEPRNEPVERVTLQRAA